MQQISKVYMDVNMNLGIPGLVEFLKDSGVTQRSINEGNIWMFLNRRHTQAKILFGGDTLLHYRPESGKVTIDALKRINQKLRGQLLGGKVESNLAKHIDRRISIVVDDEGLRVS